MTKYLFFVFLLLGCNNSKLTDNFIAKVIGVKDGDTIEVLKEKQSIIIRLSDIDCPEKSQPNGSAAKKLHLNFVSEKK